MKSCCHGLFTDLPILSAAFYAAYGFTRKRKTQRKRKNYFKTVSENDRFVKRSVGISCVFTEFRRIVSRNGPAPFLSSHFLSLHFGFPIYGSVRA